MDTTNTPVQESMAEPPPPPKRIVTFGDAAIRLTPPHHERLERATTLNVSVGGPELNVAVALASLGMDACWVSALPTSGLGRMIARAAKSSGVDLCHLRWTDPDSGRVGLTFLEEGPDPRPSATLVDGDHTAFTAIKPGTWDWEQTLDGAAAFHVSGFTLGLSDSVRAEVMQAIKVANASSVPVTFDLQYRPSSWSESDARAAFQTIIRKVDVVFASRGGLRTFFGIDGSYDAVLRQTVEKLGVAAVTVNRKRAKGSRRLNLESMAMGKSGVLASSESRDVEVVDRRGSSDAFVAGFIIGYLEKPLALSRAVSLGAAASALKHTMPGEFLCATADEVEALIGS